MIKQIEQHRSIRKFDSRPVEKEVLEEALLAATRASTVGTMQLYSIIVTTNKELLEQLSALHMNQPASKAPVIVTFCVDVSRFERWADLRGAQPDYQSFLWFVNGAIDAILASQNFCLQAQQNGLGICYLGTTLYSTQEIINLLEIPKGVVPVAAISVGYPAENVELTHRLPLKAVVHNEKYCVASDGQIEDFWSDIESSELTSKLIKDNGLDNLAQIFTQRRYKSEDSKILSEKLVEVLKNQGFIK